MLKAVWTLKKKGHCCLKSSTSTWKKAHFCLKQWHFCLKGGGFACTQWILHKGFHFEFYPFHRVQMLCRTHSMRVKIRCYPRYTHQHSHWHLWSSKFVDFHRSFSKFERALHLKRPCNDALISTIYLHRQHEQQHLIHFWLLVHPL